MRTSIVVGRRTILNKNCSRAATSTTSDQISRFTRNDAGLQQLECISRNGNALIRTSYMRLERIRRHGCIEIIINLNVRMYVRKTNVNARRWRRDAYQNARRPVHIIIYTYRYVECTADADELTSAPGRVEWRPLCVSLVSDLWTHALYTRTHT